MDHNTRKRRRPVLTFTYAVLISLVIIVGCPHQCFGGIALDVTSPLRSPPASNAEAQCNFWHDAIEDELVRFVATATFERQLDFTMMVSYNNDYVPFSGCPVEYCSSTRSCTISCNTSVAVTSGSTAALFKVTASPYDLRIGDTVVSICINVQPKERLLFVRSPPANITAAQGETVTLEYVAQGYPRPVVYVLTCRGGGGGGLFVQQSQNGSLRLSDLAVDTTVCSATASNGVESVSSTPTAINTLASAVAANSSSFGRWSLQMRLRGKGIAAKSRPLDNFAASGGHPQWYRSGSKESSAARAAAREQDRRVQVHVVENAPARLDEVRGRLCLPKRGGVGSAYGCRTAAPSVRRPRLGRRLDSGERTFF